jgi:hypothetical protein
MVERQYILAGPYHLGSMRSARSKGPEMQGRRPHNPLMEPEGVAAAYPTAVEPTWVI